MSSGTMGRALLAGLLLASGITGGEPAGFQVRVESRDKKGRPFVETSKALCEEWYPKINEALFGRDYPLPFHEVKIVVERSITNGIGPWKTVIPAYTAGGTIHVNADYVSRVHRQNPDDFGGMLIHELTHVSQNYGDGGGEGWLVEGIADYVRHKYFAKDIEPRLHLDVNGNLQGFELDRNKGTFATEGYRGGYTVAGTFLFWLEVRKDREIVPVLNRALRAHRYTPKLFQERCGAPLDSLWREFVAQSKVR